MLDIDVGDGTTKLWIQYMDMFEIMLNFIRSDRIGSFSDQLHFLQLMLPYFASTGHKLYLKTGWLYLQMMQKLKHNDPELYKDFEDGKYTARISDRFWGGIPSDQIIEQVLMRSLKTRGGLTEKGDFTEAQRNVWLHSRNTCSKVNDAMQRFVDYTSYTSEQHRDITEARLPRNEDDFKSVLSFLDSRNPLTASCGSIMNIVSGVVGSEDVNTEHS